MKNCSAAIGLDIGATAARISRLAVRNSQVICLGIGEAPRKDLPNQASAIKQEMLVGAIAEAAKAAGAKSEDTCVLGLSSQSVILRYATFPEMPEDQIVKALPFEVGPRLPFPVEQAIFSMQVVDRKEQDGVSQSEIIYAAVRHQAVEDISSVCGRAGLSVQIVDIQCLSLENLYLLKENEPNDQNVAIIDIGETTTNVNLICSGRSVLAKDISWGSQNITTAIQGRRGTNFKQAEEIKHSENLFKERVTAATPSTISQGDGIVHLALSKFTQELKQILHFGLTRHSEEGMDRIYLCGGGSMMPGFCDWVSGEFRIPAELLDPFTLVKTNGMAVPASAPSCWAMSLGLALRGLSEVAG